MNKKLLYGLVALTILILLYIVNINQQKSYASTSEKLLDINKEKINKILIQSKNEAIELLQVDTTWVISEHDSLQIKMDLLTSLFDKVLNLESEKIMTKNKEKWYKYNVDDSLGTHLALVDSDQNTLGYYVFGRSSSDYARCYVRIDDKDKVHLVNQNLMYFLQTRPQYWGEVEKESLPQEDL